MKSLTLALAIVASLLFASSAMSCPPVAVGAASVQVQAGCFALMDGTTAVDRTGSGSFNPVVKDFMLASADPVALDAVAAKLMGFEPLEIEAIRLAHDARLGVGDPAGIETIGDDVSGQSWGFGAADDGGHARAGIRGFQLIDRVRRRALRSSVGGVIRSAMAAPGACV